MDESAKPSINRPCDLHKPDLHTDMLKENARNFR